MPTEEEIKEAKKLGIDLISDEEAEKVVDSIMPNIYAWLHKKFIEGNLGLVLIKDEKPIFITRNEFNKIKNTFTDEL